jgi:hypothetical protein
MQECAFPPLSYNCFLYHLINIYVCYYHICEPCSSVSIVSGYGLDDRVIEVRFLAEEKVLFL